MAPFGSAQEWCSAMVIRFAAVDVVTSEYHFHHFLVPLPCEKCITGIHAVSLTDITDFHLHLSKDKFRQP